MPRQHLSQKHREAFAATAALTPIRAEHPLPSLGLTAGIGRVIAVKFAMAI
jgi:hypothetical protein